MSAPSLLSKTISASTIGCCFTSQQLVTIPPIGVMALSMSAAVVPGAKFCAMTTYGPAKPLMLMPLLNGVVVVVAAAAAPLAKDGFCPCCA